MKTAKAIYPLEAFRQGIQGSVVLQFDVTESGDVENIYAISGNQILAKAEIDALEQWKFKPFIKHGQPTRVTTKQQFNFYFKDKEINKPGPEYLVQLPENSTSHSGSSVDDLAKHGLKPIRLKEGEAHLIHHIAPVYPSDALHRRIEGSVVLRAVIDKDGHITDLKPISGPKELIESAIGAVQQWRYKPYLINGNPVEVDTTITVNFRIR